MLLHFFFFFGETMNTAFRRCFSILDDIFCNYQYISVEDRFFGPHGITSLATHATSTYYYFLGKSI